MAQAFEHPSFHHLDFRLFKAWPGEARQMAARPDPCFDVMSNLSHWAF
jgi:hypothetical protein